MWEVSLMSIIKQSSNSKGSLKNIQNLVNKCPGVINKKIIEKLNCDDEIVWHSPLIEDEYVEYRDADFLIKLGLDHLITDLTNFWPRNGPQWDGLAKTKDKIFLVEAKANLSELISPPTGAKAKKSIELINSSLNRTKKFISEFPIEASWSERYYQYTNRLAHLYFLREKGINAYLIFLYFTGDKEVNGPISFHEWLAAKKVMEEVLQLPEEHRLSDYILNIFVDVNELSKEI
jgi:hypothetical protein